MFHIRDVGSRDVTWVGENTAKEGEEAERCQGNENQSVQRTSGALQSNPTVDEDENRDVTHGTN